MEVGLGRLRFGLGCSGPRGWSSAARHTPLLEEQLLTTLTTLSG
jgi:hypothetical protein